MDVAIYTDKTLRVKIGSKFKIINLSVSISYTYVYTLTHLEISLLEIFLLNMQRIDKLLNYFSSQPCLKYQKIGHKSDV